EFRPDQGRRCEGCYVTGCWRDGSRRGGSGVVVSEKTRILVVDDQTVVREGLVLLLELLPDLEVAGSCGDGEQALAMVAELKPDVVLMDLRMPRMDGVEATRRI